MASAGLFGGVSKSVPRRLASWWPGLACLGAELLFPALLIGPSIVLGRSLKFFFYELSRVAALSSLVVSSKSGFMQGGDISGAALCHEPLWLANFLDRKSRIHHLAALSQRLLWFC